MAHQAHQPQQQAHARQNQDGKALSIYGTQAGVMEKIDTAAVRRMMMVYLDGKPDGLTPEKIFLSLAQQLSGNADIARCTPESLINCVLKAAEGHALFGKTGLYILPFKTVATPVAAFGYKQKRLKKMHGIDIHAHLVWKKDEVSVRRDGPMIVDIVHKTDDFADHGLDELKGGYAFAEWPDGKRQFLTFSRGYLDSIKSKSPTKTGGPWNGTVFDFFAMCTKTMIHRMCESVQVDFALMDLLPPPPETSSLIDVDYEQVTASSAADELGAIAAEEGDPAAEATSDSTQGADEQQDDPQKPNVALPKLPQHLAEMVRVGTEPLASTRVDLAQALQNVPQDFDAITKLIDARKALWFQDIDPSLVEPMNTLIQVYKDEVNRIVTG